MYNNLRQIFLFFIIFRHNSTFVKSGQKIILFFFYLVHSIWTNLIISVIIFSISVLINKAMTKNTIFFNCKFPFFDNIRQIIHWYSWTIWFLKILYHIIELFSIFASFLWQKHNNRCIVFRGKVSEWTEFVCDGWKCSDFSKPSITLKLFFL